MIFFRQQGVQWAVTERSPLKLGKFWKEINIQNNWTIDAKHKNLKLLIIILNWLILCEKW